ncbi:ParB/RepB/Spo0J family partition protein [Rhodovibrionaceae bacterium A322]
MSDNNQNKKSNLGRGLAALLGDEDEGIAELDRIRSSKEVPIEHLHPSRIQPRQVFEEDALEDLANSIRERGLIQPILVRRHPEIPAEYEIVAGERRWRASQRARLHEVPIILRELEDGEALELAIVENVQRQDLNAVEEAEGYRRLVDEFGHSQEELGRIIGKSRPHIANTLRLLNLPDPLKDLVQQGKLSAGHGRALLSAQAPEALAEQIVSKGLSVREAERLAAKSKPKPKASDDVVQGQQKIRKAMDKDPDTLALERDLSTLLGLGVTIQIKGEGGDLTIHYKTLEQLDDVLHRLNKGSLADRS